MRKEITEFRFFFYYTLLISFLLTVNLPLISQVTVNLQTPPPNQLRVADLWNVTITNTTAQNLKIYLEGTASEDKEGLIVTGKSASFELKGLETKRFNPNNIGSAQVSWKNSKYKEIIIRTGGAPTGNYTICVYAKAEETNEELGRDCKEQSVEITSPPTLISPADGDNVSDQYPNFSWLPPVPLMKEVSYSIKIKEIIGQQSLTEAMGKNAVWFEQRNILSAILQYPAFANKFEEGKKYAWQIQAYTAGVLIGESEIWWFTYKLKLISGMITREEAIDIIIKKIIVPQTLDHGVSAYLGMAITPAGSTVWPFFKEEDKSTINKPTWFGWINEDPQAFFAHDTRYVYIDAETGDYNIVTHRWWPVVDGVSLWMDEEELITPEVLIYSDVNLKK